MRISDGSSDVCSSDLCEQRMGKLLLATDLQRFAERPAGKLSGGMKQKLGLCCALIHEPDLLILDEPTTGVDPLSRRRFWDLIEDVRRQRPQPIGRASWWERGCQYGEVSVVAVT